jgi:hypothetical protein
MDQPDPTGKFSGRPCPATHLKAESDWIHANSPGAVTFIILMNMGSSESPTFANTYSRANTNIDLFGIDPYPCRTELNGCDYSMITKYVAAVKSSGIPACAIVPVYQAFGGGAWRDDGGGFYAIPTRGQEQQILLTWGQLLPNPVFDYAYSWGTQNSDTALAGSPDLQAVFSLHNSGTQ